MDGLLVEAIPEVFGGVRGPAVGPGQDGRGRAALAVDAEDRGPEGAGRAAQDGGFWLGAGGGGVGRPARSPPRTECQKVLAATHRMGASGWRERTPSMARATRSSSASASAVAPPSAVWSNSWSSLTSEPSTASPEASCRAARTEDEPTSRDKTLSFSRIDDTSTPEKCFHGSLASPSGG